MFGIFKRKKRMNDPQNTATPAGQIDQKILAKVKIPRKFEIFVEEYDMEKGWKPVVNASIPGMPNSNPIITVNSPADLQEKMNMYKTMEQRFKIIREIDPPSPETIRRLAAEQGIDIETGNTVSSAETKPAQTAAPVSATPVTPVTHVAPTAQPRIPGTTPVMPVAKAKPKMVTIGDMQLKYDGDKVYQKQWIKLNAAESRNFRIVSDSNNKLVQMTGKHIEALKWVLVEETEEGDDDSAEKLLDA